ncbi:hypothetical protein [Aerosakkonema sp. BLCC-F183]|uniref:hypothetical protein n=1 Tax=Aerosakkonema sp. BLCC-F183 TaxID=3342834 RepID=UPI0035BBDAFF
MIVHLECLFHYRCDRCDAWWSIADRRSLIGNFKICPDCGYHNTIEGIESHESPNTYPDNPQESNSSSESPSTND